MGRFVQPLYIGAVFLACMPLLALVSEKSTGKDVVVETRVIEPPQPTDAARVDFELAVLSHKLEKISPTPVGTCNIWSSMPDRLACLTNMLEPKFAKGSPDSEISFIPPVYGVVTSGFGYRKPPFSKNRKKEKEVMHTGIDLAAPKNALFVAPADGKVSAVEFKTGYGAILTIEHAATYETIYAHVGSLFVKVGQEVRRGQPLGVVGMSGKTTGPHIHFEMKVAGKLVDPQPYLDVMTQKELATLVKH
jgi:murein DD-endopeptidase MepM/ murein hydrolase activator NlpD